MSDPDKTIEFGQKTGVGPDGLPAELSQLTGVDAAIASWLQAVERGERPSREMFLKQYAHLQRELDKYFDDCDALELGSKSPSFMIPAGVVVAPDELTAVKPVKGFKSDLPQKIGRYRVEKILGRGGFGLVYLAHDDQLQRLVAIKVPHARLVSKAIDAELYLTEARTVANLDHPHIVSVFDVGSTDQFPCFVVSKYIDGTDLATGFKELRLPLDETVEIIATVAEALHYAHKQGLVHRDIKPGNILLDRSHKPFVADFGLALREEDIGKGPRYAGTPAYMSPEQARGEGHRVDARSDIFSLGVVFYELLIGYRPFKGDSKNEILEQITSVEARPLRQIDEGIPREIDRICLKSLSKRASERYSTAKDMADDLRQVLNATPRSETFPRTPTTGHVAGSDTASVVVTPPLAPASDSRPIRIVPKGLRAFDEHDADFFLELLPGPRDRDGLPDTIRFWKTRIEQPDADETFSIGAIYGPSGCGKSSLVKAGLLPRLSANVLVVHVEATAEETETRLLKGIRKRCPALSEKLTLTESLARLRQGQGISLKNKVLIIIDQFEQWLHGRKIGQDAELIKALRHCDGGRVQGIVMVRDDFWMAVTRFMRDLEIRLVEDQNSTAVDLFDLDHAQRVLAALGCAFGKLPENRSARSKEQNQFLQQAVSGLAQEDKVISVRLALFAEMMKSKTWVPATLKDVGGTAGVGVAFLEETFSAGTAPFEHRYHQKAARGILKMLLPEAGTDIKGHMRRYDELLEASGYANRPKDFENLMQILDSEIRLITPTDSETIQAESMAGLPNPGDVPGSNASRHESSVPSPDRLPSSTRYYQLTHDYLVRSLQDWLTRKQKETRRGRAELRLAERSAAYSARSDARSLPSWWEWLNILLLTRSRNWSPPERQMMRAATRRRAISACLTLAVLLVISFTGYRFYSLLQARAKIDSLTRADVHNLKPIIAQIEAHRSWAMPLLTELATAAPKTTEERRAQLHARLALVSHERQYVPELLEELLAGNVAYIEIVRDQLALYHGQLESGLWELLHDTSKELTRRFRAGLALATFATQSPQWTADDFALLARQLVAFNAEQQPRLRACLQPIRQRLIVELDDIFSDPKIDEVQRLIAANALADFAADDPVRLAQLLTVATPGQFDVVFPLVAQARDPAAQKSLVDLVRELPAPGRSPGELVRSGQRRAGAAIALLRQGEAGVALEALRVEDDDPESFTQFVHRCRARGVSPGDLMQSLAQVDQVRQSLTGSRRKLEDRVLCGLILALGEFDLPDLPEESGGRIVAQLADWYAHDVSSAIHGASGWLLRHWRQDEFTNAVDQTPLAYTPDREWFTLKVEPHGAASTQNPPSSDEPAFLLTFVVFPPGKYLIGSPPEEISRGANEPRHSIQLTRPVAISDREITWAQFNSSDGRARHGSWEKENSKKMPLNQPVFAVSWVDAVLYCRWLTEQSGLTESDQCYEIPVSRPKKTPGDRPDWQVDLARRGFRLPTEAEWEIACRSGTTSAYSFGNDSLLLPQFAWFVANSGRRSQETALLHPNGRGLFDLHGNLNEWCHDWFGPYNSAAVDPVGDQQGTLRVIRGGNWKRDFIECRSAQRDGYAPANRLATVGFRIAISLVPALGAPEFAAKTIEEQAEVR